MCRCELGMNNIRYDGTTDGFDIRLYERDDICFRIGKTKFVGELIYMEWRNTGI